MEWPSSCGILKWSNLSGWWTMNLTLAVNALCLFDHLTNVPEKPTVSIYVKSLRLDQIQPNKTDLLTIADFHAEFQFLFKSGCPVFLLGDKIHHLRADSFSCRLPQGAGFQRQVSGFQRQVSSNRCHYFLGRSRGGNRRWPVNSWDSDI